MAPFLEKKWFVYISGIVFFFVLVRYWGYYEDAGRYLLQVVNILHPERFVDDVPFMFGNQDQFTIYSPIMAVVFKIFGVNAGGIFAMLVLRLLWCVGVILLILRWCRVFGCRKWALPVFVVCMATLINKCYGSGNYFAIIDPILVARYVAFAFSIFGFAFFFEKNKIVSLIFFVVASLMHPLIGGWGIPLWLFYHYGKMRWPILVAVMLFPLTALLHIDRFGFFPADWMGSSSPFDPTIVDTLVFIGILSFWFVISQYAKDNHLSKFSSCMFWVFLAGMFLHYTGVYTHYQLLVQSQPYRVQLFCMVPMFPVLAAFLFERLQCKTPFPLLNRLHLSPILTRTIFAVSLFFFIACSFLSNFVRLSLEQGVGATGMALAMMDLPAQLLPVQVIILGMLVLLCLAQRRYLLAFVFAFSMFNDYATILPMVGMAYYLLERWIGETMRKILIVFAVIITFIELLSILPNSPLLGSAIPCIMFFSVLFGLVLWAVVGYKKKIPFLLIILTVGIWDIAYWDARDMDGVASERQADYFFDETVFPQIKNRGRMLFAVGDELPLQSRFVFLTGTYADLTINIGELFYKGQHLEARRRKGLLLAGDNPRPNSLNFAREIENVYANPDTLASRTRFLCKNNEISHLVTGFAEMPFQKQDSVFLKEMGIPVYLYGCLPL